MIQHDRAVKYRFPHRYYPSDANAVDHRDWDTNFIGIPGRGCHSDDTQQYLQTPDGSPITKNEWGCKCGYDNFHPDQFGDYLVNHIANNWGSWWQTSWSGGWDWPLVPFNFVDFSVCWLEEKDNDNGKLFPTLFAMQNSLYYTSGKWWNGAVGSDDTPEQSGNKAWEYQGWNEVAFDASIDDRNTRKKGKLHSLVVVLPDGKDNMCALDKKIAQEVGDELYKYWKDAYGTLPVIMMKNTLENGEYKKETFSQYFKFEDGACIQTGHPDCLGELCYIAGKDTADYCNPW